MLLFLAMKRLGVRRSQNKLPWFRTLLLSRGAEISVRPDAVKLKHGCTVAPSIGGTCVVVKVVSTVLLSNVRLG